MATKDGPSRDNEGRPSADAGAEWTQETEGGESTGAAAMIPLRQPQRPLAQRWALLGSVMLMMACFGGGKLLGLASGGQRSGCSADGAADSEADESEEEAEEDVATAEEALSNSNCVVHGQQWEIYGESAGGFCCSTWPNNGTCGGQVCSLDPARTQGVPLCSQHQTFPTPASANLKVYYHNKQFSGAAPPKPPLLYSRRSRIPTDSGPQWLWQTPACPNDTDNIAGTCWERCPVNYRDAAFPLCHLDKLSESLAETMFDQTFQDLANVSHAWLFYGVGTGVSGGNTASAEAGVMYGPDNQFGYYTSVCTGVSINPGIEAWVVMGGINSLENFVGNGRQWSVGGTVWGAVGGTATLALDEAGNPAGASTQVSVGIDVLPFTVSTATCNSSYTPFHVSPGATFYTIGANGNLHRTHHGANGIFDVVNQQIGVDWAGADKIFAAEGGHVYMIRADGYLYYYHFNGAAWDNPGTQIGVGWGGLRHAWAGGFGEIYTVTADGTLNYYKFNSAMNGVTKTQLGSGWSGFSKVFSGGHNAIYAVEANGDLRYYEHNEALAWTKQYVKVRGSYFGTATIAGGWGNFRSIGSAGNGEIYAVTTSGDLRLYKHDVYQVLKSMNGEAVGSGWTEWVSSNHGLIIAAF